MKYIVLTQEQSRIVAQASEPIEVRDEQGNRVGRVFSIDLEEEIAEAKRRLASGGRRWSSAQVQSFLIRLTEIRQRQGMDKERLSGSEKMC